MDPNPTTTSVRDVDISALSPGAKIGRYEVISVLGQGGFGITYRARDVQLGREVAIKEYLPTSLAYRDSGTTVVPRSTKVADDFTWGRERFVAEGRTLATLHEAPGIVKVFDFLEINGTAYIVMEMLRGDTLDARLRNNGPMGAEAIDRILWPLLDGLQQVHAAGFLHRDIKPANILLNVNGQPTLIDFGASRAATAGRTASMTAVFTPGYAAAEQFTAAKQGPWTDIYGLSATLYHAITGMIPPSAFDRMLDDTHVPLAARAPAGFPSGLLSGIDAGLAVRAGDRPQSIAEWRSRLSLPASQNGNPTVLSRNDAATRIVLPRATSGQAPREMSAVRHRAVWSTAAFVAVIVAAGAYFLAAQAPTPALRAPENLVDRRPDTVWAIGTWRGRVPGWTYGGTDVRTLQVSEIGTSIVCKWGTGALPGGPLSSCTISSTEIRGVTVDNAIIALQRNGADLGGTFRPSPNAQVYPVSMQRLDTSDKPNPGAAGTGGDGERRAKAEEEAKTSAAAAPPPPASAASPAPPPAAATGIYDGRWSVVQDCPSANGFGGYVHPLNMTVTGGAVRAQWGGEGRPDSWAITGQIMPDGSATLVVSGLSDKGLPIGYSFAARFDANTGTGARTKDRHCDFTFARR